MDPRFTVLLPTHDRADVVGYAIRSVLAQTDGDFELLVVGDGCTDGTAAVILGFGDPRIRWFDLPKAPFFGYANRNTALREARGELVAFMAHDDLMLPDHLERLAARFAVADVEWAYSRPVWVSDDGLMIPFAVDLRKREQLDFFLDVANSIPASCVMYRRTCLDRYGYWPEDVPGAGDWEHWKAIIRPSGGANMTYVPEATTLHFRASWRDPALWGPPPLHRWLGVAADQRRWPPALQALLMPGEPPQASVLRAIQSDPAGWMSATRDATAEAIDLLAWTQAAALDRMDEALAQARVGAERAQSDALRVAEQAASARGDADRWQRDAERWQREAEAGARAAEGAAAEARSARAELVSLLTSRSWRLTAPLRRARTVLRR